MNIYVFNPQYVKTSTLNYLCKIFKVKSVYNLIQDDYVDEYISNLNCKVAYNIRKTNFYNKDAAWKQGVYKFLDTITDGDKKIYKDVITSWHPIRNIEQCGVINVMVLHNNHRPEIYDYYDSLTITEDFVAYARNILMKNNFEIADSIGNILVGLNINCVLIPIEGGSYRYTPFVNRYNKKYYKWVRFLRTYKSGKVHDPTIMFIRNSFRRDFLNNSKESITNYDIIKELLTEEGIKQRDFYHECYEEFLEHETKMEEEAALAREEAEDLERDIRDFNDMMNDYDAWPNID